ncbi:MAG: superoxide dismutase [Alistipes sp.]|nr:superoxide dismutase [Alistipes sp.]
MKNVTPKKIELTPLPYKSNALEPYISESTLHYHHDKHHAAYVNRLNELIEGTPFATMSLCDIIRHSEGAVFNNAAQVWNHTFYFSQLAPTPKKAPEGALLEAIKQEFGGVEELIRTMTSHAVQLFGSGWVWLSADRQGRLFIEQRANAGNPMVDDLHPLLSIDVWEHAYYIDHHNLRGDGVAALWKVLDWSVIEARYERACNREKCHTSTDHNGYCKV